MRIKKEGREKMRRRVDDGDGKGGNCRCGREGEK
jgi:hypothetical protein